MPLGLSTGSTRNDCASGSTQFVQDCVCSSTIVWTLSILVDVNILCLVSRVPDDVKEVLAEDIELESTPPVISNNLNCCVPVLNCKLLLLGIINEPVIVPLLSETKFVEQSG